MIRRLPNLLSVLRIALAAVFPFVPDQWRLVVVVGGGLSDWLDGYVARRFDAHSSAGRLLDGIADKLFVFSVLATLTLTGALAWWQTLLVISRDLAVTFVAAYAAIERNWPAFGRLRPRLPGKVTTGAQFVLFAVVLLWPGTPAVTAVFVLTATCSVLAAADYLGLFVTALRERRAAA